MASIHIFSPCSVHLWIGCALAVSAAEPDATVSPSSQTTAPAAAHDNVKPTSHIPVIAVVDAGSALVNNQVLREGDSIYTHDTVTAGREGPLRLLVAGIGRGELVAQPKTSFTIGAAKSNDGSYELTLRVLSGCISVEGMDPDAPLSSLHVQSSLMEALVRGSVIVSAGSEEQGDRLICLDGTATVSLLGNKIDLWQRAAEHLTVSKHQMVQALRYTGLELLTEVYTRPQLDGKPIDWASVQQPYASTRGIWEDDGVLSRLGTSGWNKPEDEGLNKKIMSYRFILNTGYDDNISRSAIPARGLVADGQASMMANYSINKTHTLRAGAQARAWEYPRLHDLQLWMGGAHLGWQMKRRQWFGGVTLSGVRFWGDRGTGGWYQVKEVADTVALRSDIMRLVGRNLTAGQVSTSYEYYPGGPLNRGQSGINNSLRVGNTCIYGSGRMLDIGLRAGVFNAQDDENTYTTVKPSAGIAWRYAEVCNISGDYGCEWRRFRDNLRGDESHPRVMIHTLGISADWWYSSQAALGPYLNYTYQGSTDAFTSPTYHRTDLGLRFTFAW